MEPENSCCSNQNTTPDAVQPDNGASCASASKADLHDEATKCNSPKSNQNGDQQKSDQKKEEERLSMYKALAIKLKKDLVKSREDFQKLREETDEELNALKLQITTLEKSLEDERETSGSKIASLEAKCKMLKEQLESSETEFQNLQSELEDYKIRASKIMQETLVSTQQNLHKPFEDERYKQLKQLNEDLTDKLSKVESQLSKSIDRQRELEQDSRDLSSRCQIADQELAEMADLRRKFDNLKRENENLKTALTTLRPKFRDSSQSNITTNGSRFSSASLDRAEFYDSKVVNDFELNHQITSASNNDESASNSGSQLGGYLSDCSLSRSLSIPKPTNLDEAQDAISSLCDQIKVLQNNVQRLKRETEPSVSAQNMEYLKNVVLKFITLDNSHLEQKHRLVPVLSTVLKLTPEETSRLNSVASSERQSLASSLFKFPLNAYQFS